MDSQDSSGAKILTLMRTRSGRPSITTHHGSNEQQAMMADLAAAGVEIVPERSEDANGRFAWITDPEGNRVELGSRHAEPSKKVVS